MFKLITWPSGVEPTLKVIFDYVLDKVPLSLYFTQSSLHYISVECIPDERPFTMYTNLYLVNRHAYYNSYAWLGI